MNFLPIVCLIVKVQCVLIMLPDFFCCKCSCVQLWSWSGCRIMDFWIALFCSSCSLFTLFLLLISHYALGCISCIYFIGLVCTFPDLMCFYFSALSSFHSLLFCLSIFIYFAFLLHIFLNFLRLMSSFLNDRYPCILLCLYCVMYLGFLIPVLSFADRGK